jgi:SAM-dependent methyltransferase
VERPKPVQILNEAVSADLAAGRKIRLNLGAGGVAGEGFYAVDHLALPGVDVVADLNAPLTMFPDNSVSEIISTHVFEHIQNFQGLLEEVSRIVEPGGKIVITVPHFSNVFGFSDPTHVRFFGLYTMYYYVDQDKQPDTRKLPAFYSNLRFDIKSVRIEFYTWGTRVDRYLGGFMTRFFNKSMKRLHFYESRLAYLYPAWQIRYEMSPLK